MVARHARESQSLLDKLGWRRDALERIVWTAVEAGAAAAIGGFTIDLLTDWPRARAWLVSIGFAVVTTLLAAVKTVAARHVGAGDSAAITLGNSDRVPDMTTEMTTESEASQAPDGYQCEACGKTHATSLDALDCYEQDLAGDTGHDVTGPTAGPDAVP